QVALLPGFQLDNEVLLERAAFAEKSAIGKRAEPIEVSLDGGDAPFEAVAIELLVVRGRDRGRGWRLDRLHRGEVRGGRFRRRGVGGGRFHRDGIRRGCVLREREPGAPDRSDPKRRQKGGAPAGAPHSTSTSLVETKSPAWK